MFQSGLSPATAGLIEDATTLTAEFVSAGYIVHLFLEGFSPLPTSTHADFLANEATFTGYSSITLGETGHLFSVPVINSTGQVVVASAPANWVASDAVSPNMIAGMWIENTANGVRRYVVFPTPLPMNAALQFIDATIYEAPGGGGYVEINN